MFRYCSLNYREEIEMKLNKRLFVTFDATTLCNRGCSHCMSEAGTKNFRHFTLNQLSKLIKEIKRLNYEEVGFCITGGGEPFLNPQLVDLIDFSFNRLGSRLTDVNIVTSGFLPDETLERSQVVKLFQRPYIRKLTLAFSFNLFNPKFPARLANSLAFVINSEKILRGLVIKLCLGLRNFRDSYIALADVFQEVQIQTASEISPFFVPPYWQSLPERFSSTIWSRERFREMNNRVFVWPCVYVVDNHTNWLKTIEIRPLSLTTVGRAKNLKDLPFWKYDFCPAIFWPSDKSTDKLFLGAGGTYFPTCCSDKEGIRLGKLSITPIPEVLRRKKLFSSKMLRLLLADKREYTPEEMCDICKDFKEVHFDF